ncbi:EthD domain-containing protein [Microbacterium sp. KSW2-21]|uniref:EthD domain-containing protein n=1 Tax=Microbacterium algihabitans TaxID=3075992 RepID=A0ABU3RZY4_9MICO|nr:EthD domain-containing protein [Microbacterium sp. KSW2-21]MDU0328456.1 EthD domain-containing protein [Microbacterium sp. KSW2-21]
MNAIKNDRAADENHAAVASIISLQRPLGVSRDDFDAYWSDVHAPIMARMPGIWGYSLHHLEAVQLPYWHLPQSIERIAADHHTWDGFAELLYESPQAAAEAYRLSDAPGGYTHEDAQSAFWVGLFYQSNGGSRTIHDTSEGADLRDTVYLALRYQTAIEREHGHDLTRELADRAVRAGASRVRYHLFHVFDNDALDPGLPVGMRHDVLDGEAVDAVIEIGANHRTSVSRIADALSLTAADDATLSGAYAYRRRQRNDMVIAGTITEAGIRTPHVSRLIERLGAVSQSHPNLSDLMLTARVQEPITADFRDGF